MALAAGAQAQGRKPARAPNTESPDARAGELKEAGDQALDQKRFEDALAAYDASYALAANPTVLYNRGRALQFLARYVEALEAIEGFAANAGPELKARVPGLPTLLADLRARVATLAISCDTRGARLLLDKKEIGTCPLPGDLRVNAGSRTLEAFAEGYFPFQRPLSLTGGTKHAAEVRLTSRERNGLLVIRSGVAGAHVSVDGQSLGVAPAETGVSPGPHRVEVSKAGHDDATTQVIIQRGDRKELSLDPTQRPSVLKRWWFWTGIGVVVAGAVTTVVLLGTERSPSSGDFSPGRVTF